MEDSMKKLLSVEKDNKLLVTTLDELKKNLKDVTENAAKMSSQHELVQENLKRQMELKMVLQQRKINTSQQGEDNWIESAIDETVTMIEFLRQQLKSLELDLKEKDIAQDELKVAIVAKDQELQQTEEVAMTLHNTCQQLHTRMQSIVNMTQGRQQGADLAVVSYSFIDGTS